MIHHMESYGYAVDMNLLCKILLYGILEIRISILRSFRYEFTL